MYRHSDREGIFGAQGGPERYIQLPGLISNVHLDALLSNILAGGDDEPDYYSVDDTQINQFAQLEASHPFLILSRTYTTPELVITMWTTNGDDTQRIRINKTETQPLKNATIKV